MKAKQRGMNGEMDRDGWKLNFSGTMIRSNAVQVDRSFFGRCTQPF